jgi:thiamine kinase-like enzyme
MMNISIDNVTNYLLNKKLIDPKSIVDGDLKIIDASRKNRNIKVIRKNAVCYLLKQATLADPYNAEPIRRESRLYTLAQTDSDFISLGEIMPRTIDYDSQNEILIIEFITNGQSLHQFNYNNQPRGVFQKAHGNMLGKIMANYHTIFEGWHNIPKVSFLPRSFPFILFIAQPSPDIFSSLSSANLQLLKIIQQDRIINQFFENFATEWQIKTLIHGDFRSDNVVISHSENDNKSFHLKIVDWECADFGDPAWDIGGVFHDFLSFWLSLLPITGKESPKELMVSAEYPLQNTQAAIRAFWHAYRMTANIEDDKANVLLVRSTKYCAARLLQTAYESLQSLPDLSNMAVYMVQMSANILGDIENAIVYLFGIPFNNGQ